MLILVMVAVATLLTIKLCLAGPGATLGDLTAKLFLLVRGKVASAVEKHIENTLNKREIYLPYYTWSDSVSHEPEVKIEAEDMAAAASYTCDSTH